MSLRSSAALLVLAVISAVSVALLAQRLLGYDGTLWRVVHERCVPSQLRGEGPAPCRIVDLRAGAGNGYAVFKDLRGRAQYLLIPTARVAGIESPELLRPGTTNYFAQAWRARSLVEERLGHPLGREDMILAVNAPLRRSQGQLHIHIDCLRRDVRDALRRLAPSIGDRWELLGERLAGRRFRAMRVLGEDLGGSDPFGLLARDGGARTAMGEHSLAVVGADFPGEGPGFVILDGHVTSRFGKASNAEILQDHGCGLGHDPDGAS